MEMVEKKVNYIFSFCFWCFLLLCSGHLEPVVCAHKHGGEVTGYWPVSFEVPPEVDTLLNNKEPLVVLYGAMGRHNFGDILMPEVTAKLLINECGINPEVIVYADVIGRDMRPYGGQNVISIVDVFNRTALVDVILVGGETLGCDTKCAVSMTIGNAPMAHQSAVKKMLETPKWQGIRGMSAVYVMDRSYFENAGVVVANTIGGNVNSCLRLKKIDFVSLRNPKPEKWDSIVVAPDSVVLVKRLLDARIRSREKYVLTRPRGYILVHFFSSYNLDPKILHEIALAASEHNLDILFSAAGVAYRHDSLETFAEAAATIRNYLHLMNSSHISVDLNDDFDAFSICFLISRADIVITTSMHMRLVAFAYSVPRLSLPPARSKVREFMKSTDTGLPSSLQEWSASNLSATIAEALVDPASRDPTTAEIAADRYMRDVFDPYSKLLASGCRKPLR